MLGQKIKNNIIFFDYSNMWPSKYYIGSLKNLHHLVADIYCGQNIKTPTARPPQGRTIALNHFRYNKNFTSKISI